MRDTQRRAAFSVPPSAPPYLVITNAEGRVTELNLQQNNLVGTLPDLLGSLANLLKLSLWGNDLSGPIPSSLGDLTSLEYLYLGGNALSGPIPASLGNLTRLRNLDISRNNFDGESSEWGRRAWSAG